MEKNRLKKLLLVLFCCTVLTGWASDPFYGELPQVSPPKRSIPIKISAKMVFVEQAYAKDIGAMLGIKSFGEEGMGLSKVTHGLAQMKVGYWQGLSLRLSLLEKQGRAKLIASPYLQTLSGQAASIESGEEVPYRQISKGGVTGTAFKKAVLSLKVKPTILKENAIRLEISVSQDQVSPLLVQGVPRIRTQKLNTKVLLHNGETVMLGGIYEDRRNQSLLGLPWLSKIPLFGWFFKSKRQDVNRKVLLIFIRAEVKS